MFGGLRNKSGDRLKGGGEYEYPRISRKDRRKGLDDGEKIKVEG